MITSKVYRQEVTDDMAYIFNIYSLDIYNVLSYIHDLHPQGEINNIKSDKSAILNRYPTMIELGRE